MESLVLISAVNTPLVAAAAATQLFASSELPKLSRVSANENFKGFAALKGFLQMDQNGTLTIYQSNNRADLTGPLVVAGNPVGANNTMFVTTITHVAGGNGSAIIVPIYAAFVNFVLENNGGAPLTILRLHIEATE